MINIYVGSQHGNAEGIANEIYGRLKEVNKNLKINIYSLNELLEHINPKKVIIITSTTGNADIPDNASKFWLKIKKRTLEKNYYENMSYLILGLGDTNYSVFCAAAKKISKRLKELGACELNPLITMDDEVNDYDEKLDIFMEIIKEHFDVFSHNKNQ
tara:strand:+ start:371 stop:844 length:474 start_codon:yes stop_codon:yes gene_type:complete